MKNSNGNYPDFKNILLYSVIIPVGFVGVLKLFGLILKPLELSVDLGLFVGAIFELVIALVFFFIFRETIKKGEKHILTVKRFLFCFFYLGIPFLANGIMSFFGGELKTGIFSIIAGVLAGVAYGLTEEVVFRGVAFNKLTENLKKSKNVYIISALLTAGVFGLCHFSNLLSQPFLAVLGQVYFAFAAGMAFSGIYLISGTLIVPIFLHVAVDICHSLIVNDATATVNSFNFILAIFSTVLLAEGLITVIYWQKKGVKNGSAR